MVSISCYIINCRSLRNRLKETLLIPELLDLDYSIIYFGDVEEFTDDIYDKCSIDKYEERVKKMLPILNANIENGRRGQNYEESFNNKKNENDIYNLAIPKKITKGHLSLLLKHHYVLKKIAAGDYKYGLILEDDVRLKRSSKKNFEKIITTFDQENGDYLDLAGGCNLGPSKKELKTNINGLVKLSVPRTRTTAAIVISKKLANDLIKGFLPFVLNVDWHYQYLMTDLKLNCYWAKDPIFIHGSQKGIVKSSLV